MKSKSTKSKSKKSFKRVSLFNRYKTVLPLVIIVVAVSLIGAYAYVKSHAQTPTFFAPSSFWYQPVPNNAPVAGNSSTLVSNIVNQMHKYYGTPTRTDVNFNTSNFSAPVYTAPAGTPGINVSFNDCQGKGYFDPGLQQQWTNVPIPSFAQPSDGTDHEMVIYSPSQNKMWEFWITKVVNGQWSACWGGRMDNVSTNNGMFPNPYGTTATGLPFVGGQVTPEELQSGVIDHAIGMSLVETRSGGWSWPATRTDGWINDANVPYEGERFRIDPNLNIDALGLPPVAKAVAKAGQKYGFIIWDTAGAVSIRGSNVKQYTQTGQANPYPALFGNLYDYNVLDSVPWDKLVALPMDYGKNATATTTSAPVVTATPAPTAPVVTTPPVTTPSIVQTNNLLSGKTLTASRGSAPGGFNPNAANDGNEATRWISDAYDGVTLGTDLGSTIKLTKVSILWAGDTTKNYDIQMSADNVNWTTVASGTTNNTAKQLINHTQFSVNPVGRYMRIVANTRWNTSYGNSIWELGVYGITSTQTTPVSAQPAPPIVTTSPANQPTPTLPTPTTSTIPVSTPSAPPIVVKNVPAPPTPNPVKTISSASNIKLVSQLNNRCVANYAGRSNNGTAMQLYDCNKRSNQRFDLNANGEIRIRSVANRCIDDNRSSTAQNNKIQLWHCNGSSAQKWTYLTTTSEIKGIGGKCMTARSYSRTIVRLALATCNGAKNQKWTLGN